MGTENICQAPLSVKLPEFTNPFKSKIARIGENATFSCKTDKPEVDVIWMKNGQKIEESHKHVIVWDGCDHSLEVLNVDENDQADYSAHILGTENICVAPLNVKIPEITLDLVPVEAELDKPHTFCVELEYESVNVTWHKGDKNSEPLENSDKYRITKEGRKHKLEILNVELFDEDAYYACIAQTNKFTKTFLSLENAKKVRFAESESEEDDSKMDDYIAGVLAGTTDDELDDDSLEFEALRKKRASKELDSADLEAVKAGESF